MASGSGSRRRIQGSAGAGADALNTLTNPELVHLPAVDLVVRLHRDGRRGSAFADVALVLAERERRLAEAEARIRAADVVAAGLQDTIRALELRVANAEAQDAERERRLAEVEARIRAADVVTAGMEDTIRALELRVANAEAQVAGEDDDESQAGDSFTASDIGAAELQGGEIQPRALEIVVPELGASEITPAEFGDNDMPAEFGDNDDMPAEFGDNDMPASPIPLMRIDPVPVTVTVTAAPALPDELIEEGATARKRKEPASDLPLTLDDLRITGQKVSEEEALGEDGAASPHRHSQVEKPATKKARRQKEPPSFYTMVYNALVEKQQLLKKKEKEALAKKNAAAASKQKHCACWWSN